MGSVKMVASKPNSGMCLLNQSGSNAIACIQIGDKPQKQVKVGDDTFCAEPK